MYTWEEQGPGSGGAGHPDLSQPWIKAESASVAVVIELGATKTLEIFDLYLILWGFIVCIWF